MELVAEVGDVATGRLTLVLAHHDGQTLSIAAWHFTSTGEDETLVPAAPPAPLLAIDTTQTTDADALKALVVTRSAASSPAARPQGIAAATAEAALAELHTAAVLALDVGASPASRVPALAAFTRGLDDDLLFSTGGLRATLAALRRPVATMSTEGSARRSTVTRGNTKISMLRKADGWVIDAVEPPM